MKPIRSETNQDRSLRPDLPREFTNLGVSPRELGINATRGGGFAAGGQKRKTHPHPQPPAATLCHHGSRRLGSGLPYGIRFGGYLAFWLCGHQAATSVAIWHSGCGHMATRGWGFMLFFSTKDAPPPPPPPCGHLTTPGCTPWPGIRAHWGGTNRMHLVPLVHFGARRGGWGWG